MAQGGMNVKQQGECPQVEEQVRWVQAGVSKGEERDDGRMVGKRNSHTRKKTTNKWAVNKVFNRVFSPLAKYTSLRIGIANKSGHSSSRWPGVQKKFNKDDKGGRFNFVMSKLYPVGDSVDSVTDWNLKLKKGGLPIGEACADGV